MLKVAVIGSGNVAQHLIRAFGNAPGINLVQAWARHPEKLDSLLPAHKVISDMAKLADADIYVIAITDDAIAEVSGLLPFKGRLVVHTSGSVAMEQLDGRNRRGVFYPLQTFSKSREVDFTKIPLCLECEQEADYKTLEQLAAAISPLCYRIDSKQRQALHVAAVFVNNFTNHLYAIGNDICMGNNIPFSILKPLIQETAAKVLELSPMQAQTGPAVRHDEKTIEKHLQFLGDDNQKTLYKLLTQSIQQAHGQKL